jgi:hypothetical protein
MQHNVKIAGRASELASFAAAAKTDAGAVFHARRNLRLHRALRRARGLRLCTSDRDR